MQAAFLVERNAASHGSGLTGVQSDVYNADDDNYDYYGRYDGGGRRVNGTGLDGATVGAASALSVNGQLTPPDDYPIADKTLMARAAGVDLHEVTAWMEIWDYVGGTSFRAFMTCAADDENTLFVFFDAGVQGRDLKQALIALIELADGPLACSHMAIAMDRDLPVDEAKTLQKGLEWAGFSLTTLDFWSGGFDVTSTQWLFMGTEM